MKKRLQGLLTGLLIGAILTSGMVFAKQISETAELFYNNIKIYIDGGEIVPKDANGNTVEPFTMNGTTYLPVRAISNAFGKDVEWDGATQSVYIGKRDQTKPDNYLDRIQYSDYKEKYVSSWMSVINGNINDYNEKIYTNGLLFCSNYDATIGGVTDYDDKDDALIEVAYPLNSYYSSLKGKIVLPKSYELTTGSKDKCYTSATDVWFYGDNRLLYKATGVTNSMPFNIDINIKGVNQLAIKIKTTSTGGHCIALTDLALYK